MPETVTGKYDPSLRPRFCGECRGTMIMFENLFTGTTPLNFTPFKGLWWNVCAAHVNTFSSNLVKCIDFSGLSSATVGWSRFSE